MAGYLRQGGSWLHTLLLHGFDKPASLVHQQPPPLVEDNETVNDIQHVKRCVATNKVVFLSKAVDRRLIRWRSLARVHRARRLIQEDDLRLCQQEARNRLACFWPLDRLEPRSPTGMSKPRDGARRIPRHRSCAPLPAILHPSHRPDDQEVLLDGSREQVGGWPATATAERTSDM